MSEQRQPEPLQDGAGDVTGRRDDAGPVTRAELHAGVAARELPHIQELVNLLVDLEIPREQTAAANAVIHRVVEQQQAVQQQLETEREAHRAARAAPPPALRDEREARREIERQVDRFWKKAPRFVLGSTNWTMFIRCFSINASEVRDDYEKKKMLYSCLQGKAMDLACQKMWPDDADNQILSFGDYSTKMRELFEPVAESENAKLEFTERQQHIGENPTFYFQEKKTLFERAWPVAMRDMRWFYDEVTKGLLNELMKDQLWAFEPANMDEYERRMKYLAAVVQKRYRAKEISEAQALGAETYINGHNAPTPGRPFIKQEPGINAMSEEKAVCYHCRKKGHFARNCPRKLAGLSPPAAAVEENNDEIDQEEEEQEDKEEINFVRNGKTFRGKPFRQQRNNRGNGRFIPNSRYKRVNMNRVGVLYVNDKGEQYIQEEEVADDHVQAEEDEDPVNTLQLDELQDEEDYSETDFISHPFLGVTSTNQ